MTGAWIIFILVVVVSGRDGVLFYLCCHTRALTWSIHNRIGPFIDIPMGGRHIHHLVCDILLLLIVGYARMIDTRGEEMEPRVAARRLLSLLYGARALTLDEFALWLNLRDVYWQEKAAASLDAVVPFPAFLPIGVAAAPLSRGLGRGFRRRG